MGSIVTRTNRDGSKSFKAQRIIKKARKVLLLRRRQGKINKLAN